jgi:pyruvate kinase
MDHRRTKILATLGPASSTPALIGALAAAGADAFRLNFSHGTHADHAANVAAIRAVEAELGRPVAIVQDLQGPKIRIGAFAAAQGIELVRDQDFALTADQTPGDASRVGLTPRDLFEDLAPGQRLLLKDGLIELRVEAVGPDAVRTRVVQGGALTSRAGLNVPDSDLRVAALSDKDRADLAIGVELGVDWVALSFVRTAADLAAARAELARLGSGARLMAKIEKPGAVERFDEILAASDGIMLARGDLGVELPPEQVPVVQRRLLARCIEAGKPVVVATQMLESMLHNPRPTRAEASDVATAIFELADVVMLSGETAAGEFPVEAVATMARIAATVEASPEYERQFWRYYRVSESGVEGAVAHSACRLAQVLGSEVVASYTWTGATARRAARHRPCCLLVALAPSVQVARQLVLGWGIRPVPAPEVADSDSMVDLALGHLRAEGLVTPGQTVILTAGVPFGQAGRTNLLRVEQA